MTLTIREAVPDEMEEVHALMALLARHHGDAVTSTAEMMKQQIFDRRLGRILVAAEPEGLVGYALILARPNLVTGGAGYDINHLFVVEWRRRAGIGRALISAASDLCRSAGAEMLVIGTHWANLGAQSAYRDMGLEEVKHGPRFLVPLA